MNNRRFFLKHAFAGPAALGLVARSEVGAEENGRRGEDSVVVSDSKALVQITGGTVRGYTRNRIYTFKGIPYGADTAGKYRFMPPVRLAPWTGIRDAVAYSFACRQVHGNDGDVNMQHFVMDFDFGMMKEDCLNLNVWTQAINDGKKRPVMLWIHGGGFSTGSSFELPCRCSGERRYPAHPTASVRPVAPHKCSWPGGRDAQSTKPNWRCHRPLQIVKGGEGQNAEEYPPAVECGVADRPCRDGTRR